MNFGCYSVSYHLSTHVIAELEEDGVRIALTIVDTPGFGDNIDNEFASVYYRYISMYGFDLHPQFPRNCWLLGTSI